MDLSTAIDRINNGSIPETTNINIDEKARYAFAEAALAVVAKQLGTLNQIKVMNINKYISVSKENNLKTFDSEVIFSRPCLF